LPPLATISTATRSTARESSCGDSRAAGFTIFEAVLVIVIVFVIVATLIPKVGQTLGHARVNRSANVVAADFFLAQSLAARQRAPVIVTIDPSALTLTISQAPPSSTVLRVHAFDLSSDFKLPALTASPAAVQVMPNGTTSASMVVTVGSPDYYHQVRITQAGQVRIIR
jgi:Tfp pilus assembly protein FimT